MQSLTRPLMRQAPRFTRTIAPRQQQTMNLSMYTRLRSAARTFEPHPFQRIPKAQEAAKPDWARQIRHLGDASLFYFPFFGLILGWPFIAKQFLDGQIV